MNNTIFDILKKDLNLKKEIEKLSKLFSIDKLIKIQDSHHEEIEKLTYEQLCNKHLALWEFRNTWVCLEDIETEIGVHSLKNSNIEMTCILYCELILNMQKFINTKIKRKYTYISIDDRILIGNAKLLIEKLNYKIVEEGKKITLVKKDVEAELTATTIQNNPISIDILKYNDARIAKSVTEKSLILFKIYKYYEGIKVSVKQNNNKLCNLIDRLYNTSNIRHNNEQGYNENIRFTKLENDEIIELYDKLFFLILYAIRTPEIFKIIEEYNKNND